MALPSEIGLYFDFNVTADGIPSGCPGLELFNSTYFDLSKQSPEFEKNIQMLQNGAYDSRIYSKIAWRMYTVL